MFNFTHALRSKSSGLVYTGRAGDGWLAVPSLDNPPFTFTEEGAHNKIASFQKMALCVQDLEVVPSESLIFNSTSLR